MQLVPDDLFVTLSDVEVVCFTVSVCHGLASSYLMPWVSSRRVQMHSEAAPNWVALQGFHNWTLNPFHMMGVAGVLGAALLCAIHGATVENTQSRLATWVPSHRMHTVFRGKRREFYVAGLQSWRNNSDALVDERRYLNARE